MKFQWFEKNVDKWLRLVYADRREAERQERKIIMCEVNFEYDALFKEFDHYGDNLVIRDFDLREEDHGKEAEEVWYVLNAEGDILAQSDCRDGAVEYIKQAISEDLFYHGHAQKYKIEQGEF